MAKRDLFDGALPAGAYQAKVLSKPVSRKLLAGDDHALPAPYNRRTEVREADVLKGVKDVLKLHNVWHRRLEGTGKVINGKAGLQMIPGDLKGMPDVLACVQGRLIAIEVKAPGGKLSAAQYGTLRGIRDAGGLALVVCSAEKLALTLQTTPWTIHATAVLDNWLLIL
jgi:hypothetical protein